ncbi:acyl-CoA dehydrogenase family protein [Pseudarthrobacter sp. fls2-241-R2A-168]|uniref:acyl-CoA dehydrogenase family protein n=1 Tax=Pseudarthrobacter sp. fls2-241-R2A-168 TaxID=3040304 RepID=UPI0025537125|nr:acyl-CoA dehydrogenase family protein [Pseudarthrobacter sp. fls2-241-R2A-168]
MRRRVLNAEHEAFREAIGSVLEKTAVDFQDEWDRAGRMPDSFFEALGDSGLFGLDIDPEYGGQGPADYGFKMVAWEEAARLGVGIATVRTHTDVVTPYFVRFGNEEQKKQWLPGIASGKTMASIAMSEPDTGSDLGGISTRAVRDGDEYVINGSKAYITGGLVAGLVVVVVRTSEDRRGGLTLVVVETDRPGFSRGNPLKKLGQSSSDTVDLFFENVRIPVGNRLGDEGKAFEYLTSNLSQERLAIAVGAVATSRAAITETLDYTQSRRMFGTTLAAMQNTKFVLAGLSAKVEAAQTMVDAAAEDLIAGVLDPADAARAKLFCTEVQGEVVDACLQLHGGAGYLRETAINRMYADSRVTRIYGGSSEVMKVIIARSMGL